MPKKRLSTRVAERVKKELGITFEQGPIEVNRGYWSHNSDIVRWCAWHNNVRYDCYDSMRWTLKANRLSLNEPISDVQREWVINAEPRPRPRQMHLGVKKVDQRINYEQNRKA